MANKRVQTHYFETTTGWDTFWWYVFPRYEVKRMARKAVKAHGGKLDPMIDVRFVTPNGDCYRILSEKGDVTPDAREVRQF